MPYALTYAHRRLILAQVINVKWNVIKTCVYVHIQDERPQSGIKKDRIEMKTNGSHNNANNQIWAGSKSKLKTTTAMFSTQEYHQRNRSSVWTHRETETAQRFRAFSQCYSKWHLHSDNLGVYGGPTGKQIICMEGAIPLYI